MQISYELIRPVVVFGRSVAQRADETGAGVRTIRRNANRFDALDMASLFPSQAQCADETPDRREIPRQLRQLFTELKAEHPAFRAHELATIGHVASGWRLDPRTVQRILASGHSPSRTTRRYPLYREIDDPVGQRLAIIRLHTEGWNTKSVAAYLQTTRRRVYETLERWIDDGVHGLTVAAIWPVCFPALGTLPPTSWCSTPRFGGAVVQKP